MLTGSRGISFILELRFQSVDTGETLVNFNTQQIKSNIDLSEYNVVQSTGKIPSNAGERLGTKHPQLIGQLQQLKQLLSEPRGNVCLGSKPTSHEGRANGPDRMAGTSKYRRDYSKKLDLSGIHSPVIQVAIELGFMSKEKLWKEKIALLKRQAKNSVRQKKRMKKIPWKHDFKNNCIKCNRAYHLQEHHITYKPEIKAFLCETCHKKITKLNTAAAPIAKTNLTTKPVYTNKIRVMLWRWFVKAPKSVKYTTGNLPILVKSIIGKA